MFEKAESNPCFLCSVHSSGNLSSRVFLKTGCRYAAVIELVNSATLAGQIRADTANIRRYADFVLGLNDIEVSEKDVRSV